MTLNSTPKQVSLNVYDLSNGMARQLSQQFVGKQFDSIFHTGIVVFGKEYFFGGGIMAMAPAQTPYGKPVSTIPLGTTTKTQNEFEAWCRQQQTSKFSFDKYDLFTTNCNHFTQDACRFLCGPDVDIPDEIRNQPEEFRQTEMGQMVANMMNGWRSQMFGQNGQNHQSANVGGSSTNTTNNNTQQQQQPSGSSNTGTNNTRGMGGFGGNTAGMGDMGSFGGGMGGMGGMGDMMNNPMAQQMMNNPQMMQDMMSNPMVQQMMSNPQMMQQMMQQQGMGDMANNPMMQQMLNNPQMMQQMMSQFGGGTGGFGGGGMGGMGGFGNTSSTGGYSNPYSSSNNSGSSSYSAPPPVDNKELFRYKTSNVPAVMKKLKSLCEDIKITLSAEDLNTLSNIEKYLSATSNKDASLIGDKEFALLERLMKALPNQQFPALDFLRLLLLTPSITKRCVESTTSGPLAYLLNELVPDWKKLPMPTQLMSLRVFCNMFASTYDKEREGGFGRKFIVQDEHRFNTTVEMISHSMSSPLEGLRLTAASLACNLALFAKNDGNDEEVQLLCTMIEYVQKEKNADVAQRMMLCIHRLIINSRDNRDLAKTLEPNFTAWAKDPKTQKLVQSVKSLLA
uniref:PPPDE domain-containing protein n=1 Tax=Percolomonas cosmopolitus TaxID=63605 RepID=A0A7S1PG31_9EUKA|mmetsp:Transcript_11652/g.43804  ORF Transcript_11652/g.43804 Transcript_11652/m.43804 type:complete len:619 (+) Transcript_11652:140-1996(+)|eukprot:CAMPEP_0117451408 /NCGR_PEP_ID=MMETSP0759-20121206/8990_1 /TAXON_ID=63605 /ORGANISM="Percolomonas cosmopolitus, Strain WS" /LENGTH=618 /DNA_ID=CAMNT_0005244003 /DNA_START=139 /DNA_END=1995 /DNA_ORIENTATION=-